MDILAARIMAFKTMMPMWANERIKN
jgi:hypothetical protein